MVSKGLSVRCGAVAVSLFWLATSAHAEPLPSSDMPAHRTRPSRTIAADLDASGDYYRGYRDALRDVARANLQARRYRGRFNSSRSRWNASIAERLSPRDGGHDSADDRRSGYERRPSRVTARLQTWPPIASVPQASAQGPRSPQHAGSAEHAQGPADRPR